MKKILFIALLSTATSLAHAQQKTVSPDTLKGCWVVESNVKTPKKQVVKFYNADQQLIYQEVYEKKVLNYSRKNIRNLLDGALLTVLRNKNGKDETANLANLINRKP